MKEYEKINSREVSSQGGKTHVIPIVVPNWAKKSPRCESCQASCQSACKTSCTVSNQVCPEE